MIPQWIKRFVATAYFFWLIVGLLITCGVWWSRNHFEAYECDANAVSASELEALCRAHWGDLHFTRLADIDEETAKVIVQYGNRYTFAAVVSLTPNVEQVLAKCRGDLSFPALTRLHTPELACALAKAEGALALPRITSVSLEVAKQLAGHQGPLHLSGLIELTPEVASAFASHDWSLWLDGVRTMTIEAAREIRMHASSRTEKYAHRVGRIPVPMTRNVPVTVSLTGLIDVSPDVADCLADASHIVLPGALRKARPIAGGR